MSGLVLGRVSFAYGETPVLQDVSLSVEPGELHGLLGPNGAGKTTLVTLIAGLLAPGSGAVSVDGHSLAQAPLKARAALGLVFQSISLDRFMTVQENLLFAAGLQGLDAGLAGNRIAALSEQLPIGGFMQRKVVALSGGQQRLVDIARALIHAPRVLVLDEPTHGLDVIARQQVWSVLGELRRGDRAPAILVSTHLMDEAAGCDRVSFLKRGELLWSGTPAEALEQVPEQTGTVTTVASRSLADWFVWRAGA